MDIPNFQIAFIIPSHFIIVPYLTIRVSNSLDPDQANGSKLFAKVISRQQKSPPVGKELDTELCSLTLGQSQFLVAPTFTIWLKCWL